MSLPESVARVELWVLTGAVEAAGVEAHVYAERLDAALMLAFPEAEVCLHLIEATKGWTRPPEAWLRDLDDTELERPAPITMGYAIQRIADDTLVALRAETI